MLCFFFPSVLGFHLMMPWWVKPCQTISTNHESAKDDPCIVFGLGMASQHDFIRMKILV